MKLSTLIDELADPSAYPYPVDEVDIRQTHISAVFLSGEYVYKVKKPVNYGFLDFSTLEKRRHYCDEEVRLNRRLAPDVYLGVVPVVRQGEQLCFEGEGEPVEWAVKMRRLPDEATLQYHLENDDVANRDSENEAVDAETMQNLGRRIAAFHAEAESGSHIDAFGRFEVVAGNARENFEQSSDQVGTTVSEVVFSRIQSLTEEMLSHDRALIESRADRGVPRDTHGDLRLGHIYLFPDRQSPGNLVVIDCIEFAERFRFSDPISDVAFLVMGLHLEGFRDLADEFFSAYLQTSGDEEGRKLMPFYTAYRAVVRGKVEGMKLSRSEITEAGRTNARKKSIGSWLLALSELETPSRRPCLLLVMGLPGTGKSTLAKALAERADLQIIRSDEVRKELATRSESHRDFRPPPQNPDTLCEFRYGEGIYTEQWNRRTYDECLRRAKELLFLGRRVIVDANFRSETDRREFLGTATRWGVRSGALMCEAGAEVVRERLANRKSDASDADWSIHEKATESWEEPSPATQSLVQSVDTGGRFENAVAQSIDALQQWNLIDD